MHRVSVAGIGFVINGAASFVVVEICAVALKSVLDIFHIKFIKPLSFCETQLIYVVLIVSPSYVFVG